MEKKYIILCMLLLFIPTVIATEGMEIEEIRVYVNNERQSSADEDGGDFYVKKSDTIDIIIEFFNHNDTITEAKIEATLENIDDGSDITKDQDWFDIDPDDDRSKMISFVVPDNAREDDYDLTLEITYKYSNGTQEQLEDIDFEVTVKEEKEQEKSINLEGAFDNLTNICGGIAYGLNDCFGFINSSNKCESSLSTCNEQKGVCTTDLSNNKEDLKECTTERTELKKELQDKDIKIGNMITTTLCKSQKDEAVKAENKKMTNYGLVILIIAGGAFWVYDKKRKGQDVGGTYEDMQG